MLQRMLHEDRNDIGDRKSTVQLILKQLCYCAIPHVHLVLAQVTRNLPCRVLWTALAEDTTPPISLIKSSTFYDEQNDKLIPPPNSMQNARTHAISSVCEPVHLLRFILGRNHRAPVPPPSRQHTIARRYPSVIRTHYEFDYGALFGIRFLPALLLDCLRPH